MRTLLLLGASVVLGAWAYRNWARQSQRYAHIVITRRGDSPRRSVDIDGFKLTSPAFLPGQRIPALYTGEADDKSPPLYINGTPEGTRSLALIMEDLDVPMPIVFTHWLVWNIPPHTTVIPENRLPLGAVQGRNTLKNSRYNGPCPPNGTHHYHFKLFALDTVLDLPEGASKGELKAAMRGHILAETDLIGTYSANRTTRGNLFISSLAAAAKGD